jgi:chitodextrinase
MGLCWLLIPRIPTGNTANSSSVSVTVSNADTTRPSTPTGLTGTAVSATRINLAWTASTDNVGVTGYRVLRGGAVIATVNTQSYSDTTVAAGATYSYSVVALDGAGNASSASAAVSVTTPSATDTTPPPAPTGLTATVVSANQINLKWAASTDSSGIKGYNVYRSGTRLASVSFTNETASGWQNANFSTPVSLSANTTYIVSYFAPVGHYAADIDYFYSTGVNSGNLHALKNGTNGGNGVYRYGTTSRFPTQTYNASNYWVDVITR